MRYRKKPVVIEAMQFVNETKDQVYNWVVCTTAAGFGLHGEPVLKIQTLEGVMTASLGDYVIKGVKGEFYPCKPDIFEATYEEVEEAEVGQIKVVFQAIHGIDPSPEIAELRKFEQDRTKGCPVCGAAEKKVQTVPNAVDYECGTWVPDDGCTAVGGRRCHPRSDDKLDEELLRDTVTFQLFGTPLLQGRILMTGPVGLVDPSDETGGVVVAEVYLLPYISQGSSDEKVLEAAIREADRRQLTHIYQLRRGVHSAWLRGAKAKDGLDRHKVYVGVCPMCNHVNLPGKGVPFYYTDPLQVQCQACGAHTEVRPLKVAWEIVEDPHSLDNLPEPKAEDVLVVGWGAAIEKQFGPFTDRQREELIETIKARMKEVR